MTTYLFTKCKGWGAAQFVTNLDPIAHKTNHTHIGPSGFWVVYVSRKAQGEGFYQEANQCQHCRNFRCFDDCHPQPGTTDQVRGEVLIGGPSRPIPISHALELDVADPNQSPCQRSRHQDVSPAHNCDIPCFGSFGLFDRQTGDCEGARDGEESGGVPRPGQFSQSSACSESSTNRPCLADRFGELRPHDRPDFTQPPDSNQDTRKVNLPFSSRSLQWV